MMIKYIDAVFGIIKLCFINIITGMKISFRFPVRCSHSSVFDFAKGTKLILEKHTSFNPNTQVLLANHAVVRIGSGSGLGTNTIICSRQGVDIGRNVLIGPNVCIYDHDHVFSGNGIIKTQGYNEKKIIIEDNVWIAAGVVILKGVHIGTGSIIGAGSVISKDVPPNSVVYNRREMVVKNRF